MTDETAGVTGATVATLYEKTLGQVVHEAMVAAGEAEGLFNELTVEGKQDAEGFAAIIKAVFDHLTAKASG